MDASGRRGTRSASRHDLDGSTSKMTHLTIPISLLNAERDARVATVRYVPSSATGCRLEIVEMRIEADTRKACGQVELLHILQVDIALKK